MIVAPRESEATRSEIDGPSLVLPLWPLLWAVVLAAALWLRMGALEAVPLAPDEAARALEGRAIWRGSADGYAAGPLLPNVLSLWFGLFTDDDASARVPGALAGWGLCLTPLLFKERLGRAAALAASALLATSPLAVLASRSVHPAAFSMLATALTLGCALLAFERADGRWLVGSALAAAAGLAAGPSFVGQMVALAFAAAAFPPVESGSGPSIRWWIKRSVAAGFGAAAVFDTLFLTRPAGLQAGLAEPFSGWVSVLGLGRGTLYAAGLLGILQVLLLVVAAIGLLGALQTRFGRFLGTWALTSITLALLSRTPDLAVLSGPLLPLALLGGCGLTRQRWLHRAAKPAILVTALVALVPALFLVLATNVSFNRGNSPSWAALVIAGAGMAAILLVASSRLDGPGLKAALGLAMLIGLLSLHLTFLARLNFGTLDRAAPILLSSAAQPQIREVEERARDWWRQDPGAPLKVEATLRPILEWVLRNGPAVEWITTAPPRPERAILGGDTAASRPAGTWTRLVVAEAYSLPEQTPSLQAWWRWLVQRQPFGRPEPHAILVPH